MNSKPNCESESYYVGKVLLQRLNHDFHWYAIYKNRIIDHDQCQHDLEERIKGRLVSKEFFFENDVFFDTKTNQFTQKRDHLYSDECNFYSDSITVVSLCDRELSESYARDNLVRVTKENIEDFAEWNENTESWVSKKCKA